MKDPNHDPRTANRLATVFTIALIVVLLLALIPE